MAAARKLSARIAARTLSGIRTRVTTEAHFDTIRDTWAVEELPAEIQLTVFSHMTGSATVTITQNVLAKG